MIQLFVKQKNGAYSIEFLTSREFRASSLDPLPDFLLPEIQLSTTHSSALSGNMTKITHKDQSILIQIVKFCCTKYTNFDITNLSLFQKPIKQIKQFTPIPLKIKSININESENEELNKIQNNPVNNRSILVPLKRKEVSFLIGKNGSKIEQIRKFSNAYVKVVPLSNMNDENYNSINQNMNSKFINTHEDRLQYIRLNGETEQVEKAMSIIEHEIYLFRTYSAN